MPFWTHLWLFILSSKHMEDLLLIHGVHDFSKKYSSKFRVRLNKFLWKKIKEVLSEA